MVIEEDHFLGKYKAALYKAQNMKEIRLENFRCFQSRQSVPMAPLTLLVGDNSTGKTSFMALIHALNGIMAGRTLSNSWGSPFHFGNFDQIVFDKKPAAEERRIDAGFDFEFKDKGKLQCDFVIKSFDSAPVPVSARMKFGDTWATLKPDTKSEDTNNLTIEIQRGSQKVDFSFRILDTWESQWLSLVDLVLTVLVKGGNVPLLMPEFSNEDKEELERLQKTIESVKDSHSFAIAPIRSKPQRTYDLIPSTPDAEGAYIMPYLAELSRNNKEAWLPLQRHLQEFGKLSGLFDEIIIENYEGGSDDPFQVHVREHKRDGSGKVRNLIDVGYGVNQIIPVITELYRLSHAAVLLLQQPEIHLHPSAQAELGSLFCHFASRDQQLIVETHSDHLIDRVRMEVRDGKTRLTKDDVILLFFEKEGSDVKIHPIGFDEDGNVVGAPETYRRFFLEETTRSIGW